MPNLVFGRSDQARSIVAQVVEIGPAADDVAVKTRQHGFEPAVKLVLAVIAPGTVVLDVIGIREFGSRDEPVPDADAARDLFRLVDLGAPALFLWEGVIMYLDRDAVDATLRKIASCASGTVVAFDYFTTAPLDSGLRQARRRSRSVAHAKSSGSAQKRRIATARRGSMSR